MSCTKLQLPPEPQIRGLLPPDPRSLCPQLNLLNPPPNKIPGYATAINLQARLHMLQSIMCLRSMCVVHKAGVRKY